MDTKKSFGAVLVAALLLSAGAAAEDTAAAADAGSEWRGYVEPLLPLGGSMAEKLAEPGDAQLRHELYRFLYSQIALAYLGLLYNDPEHPDFLPYFNLAFDQAFPNPDDVYYVAPLQGDGVYRLKGYRGTVRMADFQIASGGLIPRGTGVLGANLSNHDIDELHAGKNGAFEVILSPQRPVGWKGDWWQLDEKATYLVLRQISYDWLRETDTRVSIERLDRPAIKARTPVPSIEASLRAVPAWAENWTRFSLDWVKRVRARGLTNKLQVMNYGESGGLATQRYIEGDFELAPDEALLIETELPKQCRYWNFQLTDELWTSVDWMSRQSSINGFTAKIDKDGKFRAVVSAMDPGVPNWLDTGGLKRGLVYGRWTGCSSNPTPATTRIKLADVRNYLPADTPVVSAAARDAIVRERRMAVQLRRRW